MSLKELLGNLEEEYVIKGVTIKINPLTLSHVGDLLKGFKKELGELFNATKGIKEILADMPDLAYSIIAMSIKEDVAEIKQLPIGVQLEILEKIVDISQISSDAMGKLVGRLVRGVQTAMGPITELTSMSGKTLSKEQLEASKEQAIAS